MVVARYRNDGQLDPSFGVGGVVRKGGDSYGSFLDAQAVALQSDGSIVVAGNTGINYRGTNQPMLARLRSDGSFDPTVVSPIPGIVSFGRDGESVQDMTLDKRRGRIYLAGRSFDEDFTTSSLYLAAAGTDLTLDPAFGVDGSVRTLFAGTSQDFATAVALDNKRRIVLAGSAADPPTGALALARFTRSGELDRRFGRKGRVRIKVGGGWNVARALAIQPKGRLLVAGNSRRDPSVETASAIALARLHGG
jgi:uncharacterized delta-60 repeat protein